MDQRPRGLEEEYFHRAESDKLEALRKEGAARREAEEREERRKLHYMHCPKDGSKLHEEHYHGIKVDRCSECHGVWLDHGEIETLLEKPEGQAGHFLRDFVGLLSKKRKHS